MSSLVFPTATSGLGIGWPVRKTPQYSTIVQTPVSRRGEVRLAQQVYPQWLFELDLTYLKGDFSQPTSALGVLAGFFAAVQGKAQDWLYQDPYDNAVTAAQFGTGDGATTTFQLLRPLATSAPDIVQNLNGTPTIYVAGTPVTPASIGATGLVTFTTAPASGAALTWTGGFYFRCRFDDDSLGQLQENFFQIWDLQSLKFRSVIL